MNPAYSKIRCCRLCARNEEECNLKSIFDYKPDLKLESKIAKLLPVVVMQWDPLPHTICVSCIRRLKAFDMFYECSIKTDNYLRTLIPSAPEYKVEPVIEIDDNVRTIKTCLKLPPKNDQESSVVPFLDKKVSTPCKKNIATNRESSKKDSVTKRKLSDFIVNRLTNTENIYTCIGCYRTYTKEQAATSHECAQLNERKEVTCAKEVKVSSPKSKAKMKTSVINHQCSACQLTFATKKQLNAHQKQHFLKPKKIPAKENPERNLIKKQTEKNTSKCHMELAMGCDSKVDLLQNSRIRKNCTTEKSEVVDNSNSACESTDDSEIENKKPRTSSSNRQSESQNVIENNHRWENFLTRLIKSYDTVTIPPGESLLDNMVA